MYNNYISAVKINLINRIILSSTKKMLQQRYEIVNSSNKLILRNEKIQLS